MNELISDCYNYSKAATAAATAAAKPVPKPGVEIISAPFLAFLFPLEVLLEALDLEDLPFLVLEDTLEDFAEEVTDADDVEETDIVEDVCNSLIKFEDG